MGAARVPRQIAFPPSFFGALALIFYILCGIPGLLSAQGGASDDLFSVSFPNEREGWACGRWGCILHTADGGRTWTHQRSGTDLTLSSLCFVDPQRGWAVGDEGTLLHTADGGKTWKRQRSPVPFALMRVYFATPSKGWIVTERSHILFTEDGGRSWRIQFRDLDVILKALSFCDPLHGWAVGEHGYIYHTRNGGLTWERQAGKFEISRTDGEIEAGTYLFDVLAVDPRTAWAVGIDGCVIRTVDGGKRWKEVATGAPRAPLFFIGSDRRDTLLIGGKGTFLSSGDRGRTWRAPALHPPIPYGWLYGVAARGPAGFVAVGWKGAIYRSDGEKGPASWQRVGIASLRSQ